MFHEAVISTNRCFMTEMPIDVDEADTARITHCHVPTNGMDQSFCLCKPENKKAA
jgi:hypothetical protein